MKVQSWYIHRFRAYEPTEWMEVEVTDPQLQNEEF